MSIPELSDSAEQQPSATYNREDSSKTVSGKWIVVGLVVMLALTGIYMYVQMGRTVSADVKMTAAGWDVVSDDEIVAIVDVTRDDPAKPAYCVVYALNYEVAEVGRRSFLVQPDDVGGIRLEVSIPTRERAVTISEYGCSSELPSYME
ncbi:DUF4307 domain-containing protein [Corynebacterium ulceribovis]|uniref:DUF4307 domain-containing protein n=1 Tax=Corynebacterium ulceribovis TaxID=487732 RepID=UPI0003692A82|nr:DUF4307 domain-containing protein [Corynebacterium ulceribovis]